MSRWSGMKSMTGFSVNMSNSVELTSFEPITSRANSMTAHCRPSHSPGGGTLWRTAEAQPGVRDAVCGGEVGGEDVPLDPAVAEATRHEDARRAVEPLVEVLVGESLRVDPADLRVHAVGPGRVAERLGNAEIRVRQLNVLADEGD